MHLAIRLEGARLRWIRPIIGFLVLASAWTWGLLFVDGTVTGDLPFFRGALKVLAGFGPSLAGLVTAFLTLGPVGCRSWLAKCFNYRVSWHWYVLTFLTPPALMVVAVGLNIAFGGAQPSFLPVDKIPTAILNFGLVLLVGGPFGEELGWRGYLTPALTSRINWRGASLFVGVVWGLWHLPFFYSAGTLQAGLAIPTFLVNILAGSVLFGWLYQRTGPSMVPCLVLHTSLNAWAGMLAILPTETSWRPYVLVTGLLLIAVGGLLILPDSRVVTRPTHAGV